MFDRVHECAAEVMAGVSVPQMSLSMHNIDQAPSHNSKFVMFKHKIHSKVAPSDEL